MHRIIIFIAFIILTKDCFAQRPAGEMIVPANYDNRPEMRSYELIDGISYYNTGNYIKAEKLLQESFKIQPTEEGARYLYYTLLSEGNGLEASIFKKQNKKYTYFLPRYNSGIESIYIDGGPRLSANNKAGNTLYLDAGIFLRLGRRLKLWHAFTYLQQDNNLGHFKQYEDYLAPRIFINRGWYINPSVHYAFTNYTSNFTEDRNVTYTENYAVAKGTLTYKTTAIQTLNYTLPGTLNSLNISVPVVKRYNAFSFELEPSMHYIVNKYHSDYQYTSTGTTDSSLNNSLLGSQPFSETGSGVVTDTVTHTIIYQAGAAISHSWYLKRVPITTRIAAYYLADKFNDKAGAYYFYSLVQLRKYLWLHFNWMNKGSLPWVLNTEGLYFNTYDNIITRAGISCQLFPLKHFSPLITYQYEQDKRAPDGAALIYNSIYLTLRYRL